MIERNEKENGRMSRDTRKGAIIKEGRHKMDACRRRRRNEEG